MCLLCRYQLAPCTAHEEQSNGWYGMATKQGTNSPGGEQINGLEKKLYPGNLFRTGQIPSGKSSRGTNSLGNTFPLTRAAAMGSGVSRHRHVHVNMCHNGTTECTGAPEPYSAGYTRIPGTRTLTRSNRRFT